MLSTGWIKLSRGSYKGLIKRYIEPSKYGIKKGRISKLRITKKIKPEISLIEFDRGWSKRVKKEHTKELKDFYDLLIKKYN